jgi:hypothetical protein
MSNENSQLYPSGYTLYFTIRNPSGQVWYPAGAVMETWGTGSRTAADYDIAMTDKSGDLYLASIPAALPEGTYILINRRQAGASPHDTNDAMVGGGQGRWLNGQWWEDDSRRLNAAVNIATARHTYTVTVGGVGIADVLVEAKIAGGTVTIQAARTDAEGKAYFYLPAGTYDFYATKSGYSFTNPDQEAVS